MHTMKRALLISILLLINSCSKYDIPKCDFEDATQDLPWLKVIIDEREVNPTADMKYCYISQAELKQKTVFIFNDCNPAIDKVVFLVDCEGEPVKNKKGENVGTGVNGFKDERIIWKPVDFACDLNGNTIN